MRLGDSGRSSLRNFIGIKAGADTFQDQIRRNHSSQGGETYNGEVNTVKQTLMKAFRRDVRVADRVDSQEYLRLLIQTETREAM